MRKGASTLSLQRRSVTRTVSSGEVVSDVISHARTTGISLQVGNLRS